VIGTWWAGDAAVAAFELTRALADCRTTPYRYNGTTVG